jgi:hypothetical protein
VKAERSSRKRFQLDLTRSTEVETIDRRDSIRVTNIDVLRRDDAKGEIKQFFNGRLFTSRTQDPFLGSSSVTLVTAKSIEAGSIKRKHQPRIEATDETKKQSKRSSLLPTSLTLLYGTKSL